MHSKSLEFCPTLCDRMDYRPPGSSIRGILQARTPKWVAMPSSRGSSQARGVNLCLRQLLHCRWIYRWATGENQWCRHLSTRLSGPAWSHTAFSAFCLLGSSMKLFWETLTYFSSHSLHFLFSVSLLFSVYYFPERLLLVCLGLLWGWCLCFCCFVIGAC